MAFFQTKTAMHALWAVLRTNSVPHPALELQFPEGSGRPHGCSLHQWPAEAHFQRPPVADPSQAAAPGSPSAISDCQQDWRCDAKHHWLAWPLHFSLPSCHRSCITQSLNCIQEVTGADYPVVDMQHDRVGSNSERYTLCVNASASLLHLLHKQTWWASSLCVCKGTCFAIDSPVLPQLQCSKSWCAASSQKCD